MYLLLFVAAALMTALGLHFSARSPLPSGARAEGPGFVVTTLLVGFAGVAWWTLSHAGLSDVVFTSPEERMARGIVPDELLTAAQLCLIALAVYVLSALRGAAGFPAFLADILVIGAAYGATKIAPSMIASIATSSQGDAQHLHLGTWATVLTVGWIWMVSRLCAGLSRVTAVTGGYLGLFAGLIFLLIAGRTSSVFAPSLTASLAGAGLAALS